MLLFLPVCFHSKVECSHGEVEGSTGFLKSPKAPAQDSVPRPTPKPFPSWLMPRQKDILSVTGGPVAERVHSSCHQCCIYGFTIKRPLGTLVCGVFLRVGVGLCHHRAG